MTKGFFGWFKNRRAAPMRELQLEELRIELTQKNVKYFRLAIHPESSKVSVSAPLRMSEEKIRSLIVQRLPWIRRHLARFSRIPRPSPIEYMTGEKHWFRGRPLTLQIVEKNRTKEIRLLENDILEMRLPPASTFEQRAKLVDQWYRHQLKSLLPPLILQWEPILEVKVSGWGIKQMTTRWGTCNTQTHRIWLNLELIKRSPACLEYVVVHEMVHLLERGHNPRFYGHLDRVFPGWKAFRQELNQAPIFRPGFH